MKAKIATLILVYLASWGAFAHEYTVGSLRLKRPVADETKSTQQAAGVYLEIVNDSAQTDRLMAVSTSIAEHVALHRMDNGASNMADARYLTLPGKASVVLAPGASHIMLMGLRQPLKSGQSFPLKLVFERAGAVLLDVEVVGSRPMAHHQHH